MLSCLCSTVCETYQLIATCIQILLCLCPSEALSAFLQRRISACSACSAEQKPTKRGHIQARECWTAAQHFLACEGIFMACCDIHLVQHDNLWPINITTSEFRKPYLKPGNSGKTAYRCNAEFMVSFCKLMSGNSCEALHYRTGLTGGLNPIISTCSLVKRCN